MIIVLEYVEKVHTFFYPIPPHHYHYCSHEYIEMTCIKALNRKHIYLNHMRRKVDLLQWRYVRG
jgi:hypothetical protein